MRDYLYKKIQKRHFSRDDADNVIEELEEKKREAQEKEWEIPAFLRKVKYNK